MMKVFRAVLIGSLLTIGLAVPAFAADLNPPAQQEAPTPEQYEQMGFYLRGDAGWSFLQWGDHGSAPAVDSFPFLPTPGLTNPRSSTCEGEL